MSIIKDYLIPVGGLQFADQVARSWSPQPGVVLDPAVQFGEPCIRDTRIPTRAVWSLVRGGDSQDLVARAYGITQGELTAALEMGEQSRRLIILFNLAESRCSSWTSR